MKKLFKSKILKLYIVASMLANMGIQAVYATDVIYEQTIDEDTSIVTQIEENICEDSENVIEIADNSTILYEEQISELQSEDINEATDSTENSNEDIENDTVEIQNTDEITGFGEIDVEESETISPEEYEILSQLDEDAEDEGEAEIDTAEFSGTGWQSCGTMTSARSYMSSVAIDNDIYTFGGKQSGIVVDNTEVYDTETEVWSRKIAMPFGRYKHTALTAQNKVYICGGYDSSDSAVSTISVYDVAGNVWLDEIETPNNNTNYSAGVYNDELYIFSGKENGVQTSASYKYNTESCEWTQLANVPSSGIDSVAVSMIDGFYVINNFNIYKYNATINTWTYIDNMARNVYDCAFVNRGGALSNILYVTGGRDYINSGTSVANTKYYIEDETQELSPSWKPEWYNDLRMIRGLACHNMVIADGVIYVLGGQTEYGEDQKLMFKRSLEDEMDDYPDTARHNWDTYIYGSINGDGDSDKFEFTPSEDGYYEIVHYNPIHSNNLKYAFNIWIEEHNELCLVGGYYTYEIGAIYMKSGTTYDIDIFDIEGVYRGNYMYRIGKVDDDVQDTLEAATNISLDSNINKNFVGRYDKDCFLFTVPYTGRYDINLTTEESDEIGIIPVAKATLYDSNKKEVTAFDNSLENTFNCQLKAGVYYLTLTPNENYYDRRISDYTISIHNTAKMYNMYIDRVRHGMTNTSEKLYVVGGLNTSFDLVNSIEVYDPETKLWLVETDDVTHIEKDSATIAVGEKIYVIGGYDNGTYYKNITSYDTVTKAWKTEGELNTERGRATTVADDRYIYIIGGRNSEGYIDSIEVFDTNAEEVIEVFSLPEALVDAQAFISEGTLYIVGGISYEGHTNQVYAWENESWTQKADMPYTSEYVRGKGYDGNFLCAAVNGSSDVDLLKYTVSTDEWTTIKANYLDNIIYYGFDIFNYHIYITGGYSYDENKVISNVNSYDFITDIATMDSAILVRTIGYEYEQTNNDDVTNPPQILNVNAKVVDRTKGIYELYLTENDYENDSESVPFFFWSSREGMFAEPDKDFRKVTFYADPNTGDRKVKVIVGIGDGRGYVDKKSFLLNGNSATE